MKALVYFYKDQNIHNNHSQCTAKPSHSFVQTHHIHPYRQSGTNPASVKPLEATIPFVARSFNIGSEQTKITKANLNSLPHTLRNHQIRKIQHIFLPVQSEVLQPKIETLQHFFSSINSGT
jgi:hypothetical protein